MSRFGGDYKYAAQMEAEEIAEREYGKDFYDLPDNLKSKIYQRGMEVYVEGMLDAADAANDRAKEKV